MVTSLEEDFRWRRFNDRGFRCSNCNDLHQGVFDLACDAPEQWTGPAGKVPNAEVRESTHVLSEDFCILEGTHYFVRCVLQLQVIGTEETFGYGVWATLSRKNFDLYIERFDGGNYQGFGPWFGWFSNSLKGYPETLNLKCQVHPQNGRQRPRVELEPTDHPLAREQRDGISFDRLLDIYASHGHDIRPALIG